MKHQRTFTAVLIGGLFAAAAALAACGGGASTAAAVGNGAGGGRGTSAPLASDAVDIKSFAFAPATVTIEAGSTVVWTNDDSIQHDVTFDTGGIASSRLDHRDAFSYLFRTAGTYGYICSIHPFMHGTVIVTA